MKKRIALVSMFALLLVGTAVGALPSEAAGRDQNRSTVVYQGHTVSWSSEDPSDVRVGVTADRTDRFPRAVSLKSVDVSRSRVTALASTSTTKNDSCTAVPDNFGSAHFTPACDIHDQCYSPQSSTDRRQCDRQLLVNLRVACHQAYSTDHTRLLSCYTVAAIYYVGVRLFGGYFYDGTGNPA